jgi:hypothetical protein
MEAPQANKHTTTPIRGRGNTTSTRLNMVGILAKWQHGTSVESDTTPILPLPGKTENLTPVGATPNSETVGGSVGSVGPSK